MLQPLDDYFPSNKNNQIKRLAVLYYNFSFSNAMQMSKVEILFQYIHQKIQNEIIMHKYLMLQE